MPAYTFRYLREGNMYEWKQKLHFSHKFPIYKSIVKLKLKFKINSDDESGSWVIWLMAVAVWHKYPISKSTVIIQN